MKAYCLPLKLATSLITFFLSLNSDGQSASGWAGSTAATTVPSYNPNMIPPSPEAHMFSKYGNLPVGLFTGTAQFNVPIYTISSGTLKSSITLGYSTNGVKVDEVSGRVGNGWTLQAGGIITRTIHDKPDEVNLSTRTFWHGPVERIVNGYHDSADFYNFVIQSGAVGYDFQPDEFYFNVNGLSGKFLHREDGSFEQFSASKVQISGNNNLTSFILVATNGDTYFFSQGELTKSFVEGYNYPIGTAPEFYNTSWYLNKITSPRGDSIVFHYTTLKLTGNVSYPTGVTQSYQTWSEATGTMIYMDDQGGWMERDACQIPFPLGVQTKVQMNEYSGFVLTSIDFQGGKVDFIYSGRDDLPDEKKLDSIKVIRTSDNQLIKCFGLHHFYSNASNEYDVASIQNTHSELRKRLFLDTLYEVSKDLADKQYHVFIYDSANYLPPRLSFAQDEYGFFNGKQNSYFFPNDTWLDQLIGGNHFGGDRNFHFRSARKGTLTTIKYPTGGYTKINYEPHDRTYIGKKVTNTSAAMAIGSVTTGPEYTPDFIVGQYDVSSIRVRAYCSWENIPPEFFPESYFVTLSVIDLSDNNCVYFCSRQLSPGDSLRDGTLNWHLLPGSYKISITASQPGVMGVAYVDIETNEADDSPERGLAGVRVQSIADYDQYDAEFNRKEYIYGPWEDPDESSGTGLYYEPMKMQYVTVQRLIGQKSTNLFDYNGAMGGVYCGYNSINSSSLYSVYRTDNNTMVYSKVIELHQSGNGKNNGGTEYEFYTDMKTSARSLTPGDCLNVWDIPPVKIEGLPLNNHDFLNGFQKCVKTFTYDTKWGNRRLLNEIRNYYSVDTPSLHSDTIYAVQKVLPDPIVINPDWKQFHQYHINFYIQFFGWPRLDSSLAIDHGSSGAQPLMVKSEFSYSPYSLQVREQKSHNSRGEVTQQFSYYPPDFDKFGTTHFSVPYLDIPIETITKVNAQETSKTQTLFSFYSLASISKSFNGGALETDALFEQYDDRGNLIQFKTKDGVTNSFIWGYDKTYPVAKVVGASHASCMALLNSSILNNPASESALLSELNNLRNGLGSNVMVSTFAFAPLIGITKEVDARGYQVTYEYDQFNRLKAVRDADNNVLKKYEYKYASQ